MAGTTDEAGRAMKANTFEIGLCMAGAISAGAYTAGVVDFLFEALEAWQQAKDNGFKDNDGNPVLSHDVVITCMSGASAGGMTAAAIVSGLCGAYTPITGFIGGKPVGGPNTPYECWVESLDINDLLGVTDLKGNIVRSLLDCSKLDTVANAYMKPAPGGYVPREYISQDLQVFLTLANLRGIPYSIRFKGIGGYGHEMNLHKDYAHFVFTSEDFDPGRACIAGLPVQLDPSGANTGNWLIFRNAALATGAFPLALLPRVLDLNVDIYEARRWQIPSLKPDPERPGNFLAAFESEQIYIQWDRIGVTYGPQASYKTLNVDGGTFDNEPLELARRCLAGAEMVNPREPDKARRAVLLIDPFPHDPPEDDTDSYPALDVLGLAAKILGAMKDNGRFKPEELVLSQDEDCYSRFLIGPSRDKAPGQEDESDIACGSLGGFGGFFSKRFRQHDYQLGRRNCQQFLYRHFVIPLKDASKNDVFLADRQKLRSFAYDIYDLEGNSDWVVPIIPLMPALCPKRLPPAPGGGGMRPPAPYPDGAPVPPLDWDSIKMDPQDLDTLTKPGETAKLPDLLRERIEKVAEVYIDKYFTEPGLAKTVLEFIKKMKSGTLTQWLLNKVRDDFKKSGVMR